MLDTDDATPLVGSNVPNSVADVAVSFPDDWQRQLREVSPVSTVHSYLIPYWYRAGMRWVLYDCLPAVLIDPETPVAQGFLGSEFFARVQGPPPRERSADDYCPYISDVQHEFYRLHRVYARPFWVLQGEMGGHQVAFDPWQRNLLAAQGLPQSPPLIGTLEPCPFDNRVTSQLTRLSRIIKLSGDVERLRKFGTPEAAEQHMAQVQSDIRAAEMAFLETQMAPLLDAAQSVSRRSDSEEHLVYTPSGTAARAVDALQEYKDTGLFTL